MKNIVALIVFVLAVFTVAAQSKEDKVWQKTEALTKAVFENKDAAVLEKLLSRKVTYGHSGGNVEDKQLMIKNAVANTATYKNLSLERVSVQVVKKTAIVRHLLRATTVDKGNEASLNLHILLVWVKDDGDWKLLARQAVRINPK